MKKLKRVEEVNRDDFYPYRVSKLVLFGSYLNPEQMDLGDIDIAFELEPKIKDYDELMRYNDQLVDKARKEGKSFSSLIDILGYSEKLVILKLRNKEKYISLHRMTDGILQITECRQIFP